MTISHTTPGMPQSLSPDRTAFHPFDVLYTSVTNLTTTLQRSDSWADRVTLKVPVLPDVDDLDFIEEAGIIPESSTNARDVTVSTRKLADLKVLSNELNRQNSGRELGNMIANQMRQSITSKFDKVLFGSEEHGDLVGLGALKGVTDLGTLTDNLDWYVDGVANVLDNRGAEEDISIVCSPKSWAHIAKIKDSAQGNRPLIDAVASTREMLIPNTGEAFGTPTERITTRTIMGTTMFISPFVSGNALYIFDRSNIITCATDVFLDISDDYAFERDAHAVRMTYRAGFKVYNPARIGKVTLPSA